MVSNSKIMSSEPKPIEKLSNINVSLNYDFNDQEIKYGQSQTKGFN
jgi:hypothetical protein